MTRSHSRYLSHNNLQTQCVTRVTHVHRDLDVYFKQFILSLRILKAELISLEDRRVARTLNQVTIWYHHQLTRVITILGSLT